MSSRGYIYLAAFCDRDFLLEKLVPQVEYGLKLVLHLGIQTLRFSILHEWKEAREQLFK